MSGTRTDTAFRAWDGRWRTDEGRADWLAPEPWVIETARARHAAGARTALDLGCGVGRHALALAAAGFDTHALDAAPNGLAALSAAAGARGLAIAARRGLMTALPYPDGAFDYVLAFNVIYHGDGEVVRRTIAEIARVLKPGGTYQGTMLSKRNAGFGRGREVAPDTFVEDTPGAGAHDDDKAHPHFYCDARGLLALFPGFEPTYLADVVHRGPASFHWHLTAERTP